MKNKAVFLIVFMLILPSVLAETFTWRLGSLDEINGAERTIGHTGSCSVWTSIGGTLQNAGNKVVNTVKNGVKSVGKALGLVVSNAPLTGFAVSTASLSGSKNTATYAFPDSFLYSLKFVPIQSTLSCDQSLKVIVSGAKSFTANYNDPDYGEQIIYLGGEKLNKAYFEQGGRDCSGNYLQRRTACNIKLFNLKILAFDQNHVFKNSEVFIDDLLSGEKQTPLDLGEINKLLTVRQGDLYIADDNPKVMTWVGSSDSYAQKSTRVTSDHVYACLDDDKNGVCDFKQKQNECAANADWYMGVCCGPSSKQGVASKSIGLHTINGKLALCGLKTLASSNNLATWQWAPLENFGRIYKFEDPAITITSDGTNFLECGSKSPPWLTNVKSMSVKTVLSTNKDPNFKHEYYCTVNNELSECHGLYAQFSEINSKKTGEQLLIQTSPDKSVYCSSNGFWVQSITDENTCKVNFEWTGNKCCGEPEDNPEFYEDPGLNNGICWNSGYVKNGETTNDNKFLNKDGEVYGCKTTSQTSQPFVKTKNECDVISVNGKDFVCQTNGEWDSSDGIGSSKVNAEWTVDTTQGQTQQGCCLNDWCWKGDMCKKRGEKYYDQPTDKWYICQ